jgi:hypothetical protein
VSIEDDSVRIEIASISPYRQPPDAARQMTTRNGGGPGLEDGGVVLTSEFASVRISVDHNANGVRLLVEDIESGARVFLEPLELASFCHATAADRVGWLRVGPYRDDRT